MQVSEAMSRRLEWITGDATLQEAARLMRDENIGALPVCEGDKIAGMVTDRDIVIRAVAEGRASELHVRDVMSSHIEWCYDDEELIDAARKMEMSGVRRLVVLDHSKRAVGLLSIDDIAAQPEGDRLTQEVLDTVSPGTNLNA